jgi:uncharacterized membrane protein YfcA
MEINLNLEMLPLIFIVALIGGGAFILQPFLFLMGIPPQLAMAHDVTTTTGMNISSIGVFKKQNMLDVDKIIWWIPGMIIGPFIGIELLQTLPTDAIKWAVTLYCLGACLFLLFKKNHSTREPIQNIILRRITAVIFSFIISAYIGFSGAGAAFITGTALVLTHKISMKEMVALRHIIHILPSSIASLTFIWMGWIDLYLGLTLFSACLLAGYLGSHMVIKLPENVIRILFSVAGILMSLAVIIDHLYRIG